jgi:hypothetical protein
MPLSRVSKSSYPGATNKVSIKAPPKVKAWLESQTPVHPTLSLISRGPKGDTVPLPVVVVRSTRDPDPGRAASGDDPTCMVAV